MDPQPTTPPSPPPVPPTAPPTRAAPVPTEPSRWPQVIGLIMVIWAAIGLAGAAIGLCFLVFVHVLPALAPGAGTMSAPTSPLGTLGMLVGTGLTAFLLALGIGVLKRRRWVTRWLPVWAVLTILESLVGGVAGYLAQQEQLAAMAAQTGKPLPAPMFMGLASASLGCGTVFALAPPVVLLIWFTRSRIRKEIDTWGAAPV